MNKKLATTLMSALLVIFVGAAGGAHAADFKMQAIPVDPSRIMFQPPAKKAATSIYIVQLADAPVVAYDGGMRGYRATKPRKGQKLDPQNRHVRKYAAYLEREQDRAIQSVGGSKVYSYRYGLNGFAARMTAADADALRNRGDVVNVWKDELMQPQTDTSPTFIGLTEGGQAWSKGNVGEDVVIGVVDTGIWPEHPSFADEPTPMKGNKGPLIPYGDVPAGFVPSGCDFGNVAANPLDAPFECNNKLLTARCYNRGFSDVIDPDIYPCGGDGVGLIDTEYHSARDQDGHGSHTGSTAGGNYGVPASIGGEDLGTVSGMAPRARVAAYKVCWNGSFPPDGFDNGCFSSDSAAAIDQAVADGVDVINFSIGGASTFFGGADDIAFLFAADAGVYVATSNGNSGPGAGTVGTPAGVPWLTAVGANQDDQVFNLAVQVNAPAGIAGDKVALEGTGPVRLADAGIITADVVLVDDGTGVTNDGCEALTNAATVDGNIALVIRGACGFITKYDNAAAAGAVAIIVYNDGTTPARIDPIFMGGLSTATIPGVMVSFTDGDEMANAVGVNATMDASNTVSASNRVAGFSSRGQNDGAPDIIKPDLGAPGVSILAAQTPTPNDGQAPGELFQIISGTSMSSPHVAGAFALLKQAHPDWSAAAARSALMTTARQDLKKTFGDTPADPFDIGAGAIVPSDAFKPGLVYDVGLFEYAAFSCGNNFQIFSDGSCAFLASLGLSFDGSDLNLPSMGIAELVGTQTIKRTVTKDDRSRRGFIAHVEAPPGVDVHVTPSILKLRQGQSKDIEITFTTNEDAELGEWTFGALTWIGGPYEVRSPIAVRPVPLSADPEVDASGEDGSVDIGVNFGYNGNYTPVLSGLTESLGIVNSVDGITDVIDLFCVDLPAHPHFRFATFDADTTTPGLDDLDIRLFFLPEADGGCSNFVDPFSFVGSSGGFTSEEVIDVENAPAGGYLIVIDYFAAAVGTTIDYTAWVQPVLPFTFPPNASVDAAPASAAIGASDTVTVGYGPLAPPSRYLGLVQHNDDSGELARTIIDVDAQ
ncbi:MAG: S8 family serine peptidase [Gammaproteobacteria bacterium]|nr:S8 family serine peptidase [Gammaproteobacteria bacterium]